MKSHKKLLFTSIFIILGVIALQIPFTKVIGSDISFTLFDFFGPIAGAFLGPLFGVISVVVVQIANFLIKGSDFEIAGIIRLFPMLFAAFYFAVMAGKNGKISSSSLWQKAILMVPLFAMILFWLHPNGREAWYYALFWTIPLIAYFKKEWLLSRSLGATFTAHAVGGAAWIWAFNLPASVWNSLIPVVIVERGLFALGIAGSYLAMRYVLKFLVSKKILPNIDSLGLSVK